MWLDESWDNLTLQPCLVIGHCPSSCYRQFREVAMSKVAGGRTRFSELACMESLGL